MARGVPMTRVPAEAEPTLTPAPGDRGTSPTGVGSVVPRQTPVTGKVNVSGRAHLQAGLAPEITPGLFTFRLEA